MSDLKFTDDQIRAIRMARFEGATLNAIADRFEVSMTWVSAIVRGQCRREAGGPIFGQRVGAQRSGPKRCKTGMYLAPIAVAARMGLSWEEAKQLEAAS